MDIKDDTFTRFFTVGLQVSLARRTEFAESPGSDFESDSDASHGKPVLAIRDCQPQQTVSTESLARRSRTRPPGHVSLFMRVSARAAFGRGPIGHGEIAQSVTVAVESFLVVVKAPRGQQSPAY